MSTSDSLALTNRVAIVTGSGKENGIGAGIALALARAGARVAINYVSESTGPRAAQVVAKIEAAAGKGSVLVVRADISGPEGTKKLVRETLSGFNVDHIDILGELSPVADDSQPCLLWQWADLASTPSVNNSATARPGSPLDSTPEDVARVFEVNVYGPLFLMQAVVPHMPRGGRIVNVGSVASKLGMAGMGVYGVTKAAMDSLTFVLAKEVRGFSTPLCTFPVLC